MPSKKPIFLAYAWEDAERVSHLHSELEQRGFPPWSKDEDLPLGERWDIGVERALRDARVFLACLSRQSVGTEGFVEMRLRRALETFAQRPVDSIFVIPVRLDDCPVPELPIDANGTTLQQLHWVDLWKKGEFEKLSRRISDVLEPKGASGSSQSTNEMTPNTSMLGRMGHAAARFWSPTVTAAGISTLGAVFVALLASPFLNDFILGDKNTPIAATRSSVSSAVPDIEPTGAPEQFHDCLDCPEMVVLPPGSFLMGSPRQENGRQDHEGPRRKVTFDQPFAIGKHEVTFAQYDRFANDTGRSLPDENGWGRGAMPAVNVSRDDAAAYCSWLARETGQGYSLPTEAEWEYAARAGTDTRYFHGNYIGERETNFGNNLGKAIEVGSYPPNAWGLHDMHGNVEEWVEDPWHDDFDKAPSDGSAWWAETSTSRHVVRGGSWRSPEDAVRSASRDNAERNSVEPTRGFRCASSVDWNGHQ